MRAMRYQLRDLFLLNTALLLLAVGLSGCSGMSESSSDGDPRVISQEEIQDIGDVGDAYTLIQHYEPQWLEKRGRSSINRTADVVVYIENSRQGGPETLRQISVSNVDKIRFMSASDASMEYGSGHDNGAIIVHLKKGRNPN